MAAVSAAIPSGDPFGLNGYTSVASPEASVYLHNMWTDLLQATIAEATERLPACAHSTSLHKLCIIEIVLLHYGWKVCAQTVVGCNGFRQ